MRDSILLQKYLLKKEDKNNCLVLIFGVIVLVLSFLCVAFYSSFNDNSAQIHFRYPNFGVFDLCVNERVTSLGEGNIIRMRRPTLKEAAPLADKGIIDIDLRGLISETSQVIFKEKEYFEVLFKPIYYTNSKIVSSLLTTGFLFNQDDFSSVYLNNEACRILGFALREVGSSSLVVKQNSTFELTNNGIKKEASFILEQEFWIKGIVNEFPFLQVPTIYYSYLGAKNAIAESIPFEDSPLSFLDYIIDANDNELISNYHQMLFFDNLEELNQSIEVINKLRVQGVIDLSLSSFSYEIVNSISDLVVQISLVLLLLIIVLFLSLIVLIVNLTFISLKTSRRDRAIFLSLGIDSKSICQNLIVNRFLIASLIYSISYLLYLLIIKVVNGFLLKKIGLAFLVFSTRHFGLNLFIELIVPLTFIVSIFSSILIIYQNETKQQLSEFLRSE